MESKEFFKKHCMATSDPKHFYVYVNMWDANIELMKKLKNKGYKFSQSMLSNN